MRYFEGMAQQQMTRRAMMTATAAAGIAVLQGQPRTSRAPNIVFILADDLGYGSLGCYGSKEILTPHLDRMAAEGIRFTQAYAGSTVCAPSRCSLMTGLHTGHARSRGNSSPDLPLRPEDLTFTEVLRNAGYRTGLFGKWALGNLGSTGYPTRKGFDEWFGFFSQTHAHNYYPEHMLDGETAYHCRGNAGTRKTDYAPDLFIGRALQFVAKREERPFFLKIAHILPHANNEMGRDTGNGMEIPSDAPYTGKPWPAVEKNFAAMVTRLDADVGKLLAKLKETGKDENTLVIFASDNGPHNEGGHSAEFLNDNGPLRGYKRELYEGGIRVPFIARWPGTIKPDQTSEQLIAFWDVFPTACDAAGAMAPRDLDGLTFLPTLTGRGSQRQHEYLYWEFHEGGFSQALRMGDWKAVRRGAKRPIEIYDLKSGLDEQTDLAVQNPDVVRRAEQLFAAARTESALWPVR